MPDMEDPRDIAFYRKEDSVEVRLVAVQKLAHLHRRLSTFGRHEQRKGRVDSEVIASRRATNQRSPASPACCERSQS